MARQALNAIGICPMLQKECRHLVGSIVQAVEPQLDACRYEPVKCLAAGLHILAASCASILYMESEGSRMTCGGGRPEDLATLAAELCMLGVLEQHAALVRRAVERGLKDARSLSARQLASMCRACGQLGNVPSSQMLVRL